MAKKRLTHLDDAGRAKMVDVSAKPVTVREAIAEGFVVMHRDTLLAIAEDRVPKGEVLSVARVAGVMAAKQCGNLIPLCHPLPLESIAVEFDLPDLEPAADKPVRLGIKAVARITAKTGVEMEALTAVSLAALTVYDMCKGIDRGMSIEDIRLLRKTGGTKNPPPPEPQ
jgi:cyclic pyranopterin monophosphate synthase